MSTPILATKLYLPPRRPRIVLRPRLVERLNEGVSSGCKLTLLSAPAGFGKTTLVSEWVAERTPAPSCAVRRCGVKAEGGRTLAPAARAQCGVKEEENLHPSSLTPALRAGASVLHPSKVAWLSLDSGDNDPARFLTYLIAALQTIAPSVGAGVLAALESPQPPATDALLTVLLNEIAAIGQEFILVLDDYHLIDAKPVDQALSFLLEHQPPQMHLVITTREDPQLPLARLRARGK